MRKILTGLAGIVAVSLAGSAFANNLTVGNSVSYNVLGNASVYQIFGHDGSPGGGGASTNAVQTTFAAAIDNTFTFDASGLIGCCGSANSGPDGGGGGSGISPANGLSGLSGNSTVPLVAVFTSNSDPFLNSPPAALTYDVNGTTGVSPLLNQVFFIGDGHAGYGNSSGATLSFLAPSNATQLYIGILDGNGFGGLPGFYADNPGSFTVNVSLAGRGPVGGAPEPTTWAMMILGVGMAGAALRRRQQVTTGVQFS